MTKFSVLVIAAWLSGCVATAPQRPSTAAEIAAAVAVHDSSFDARKRLTGPRIRVSAEDSSGSYMLRAFVDKASGETSIQAYAAVYWFGGSWRFYRSASFVGGHTVSALRIDSDVRCKRSSCSHEETVGIDIPKAFLTPGAGLQLRLNGRTGPDVVLAFTPEYVDGMLAAVRAAGGRL